MSDYELMFILDPSLEQEKKDEEVEKIKGIISENGEPGEPDVWGMKKLAYEIEKNTEGYYVVLPFKADPELPKELDRRLRISDTVMRHMIVNKDEK
jgi:small subunit ribosomal protein S6